MYIANGLATTYNNIGFLFQKIYLFEEATAYYQKAIVILEDIHTKNPDNIDMANGLATTYNNIGDLFESKGDLWGAKFLVRRAFEICNKQLGKEHYTTAVVKRHIMRLRGATLFANGVGLVFLMGGVILGKWHLWLWLVGFPLALRGLYILSRNFITPANIKMKKDMTPRQVRSKALEIYKQGKYAEAHALLMKLLDLEFEVVSTRLHLARICFLTDQLAEARQHVDQAWEHRSEAPHYVVPRILWFQTAFALLDGASPTPFLASLKTALESKNAIMDWTMDPVLDHLKSRLTDEQHSFLTAFVAALSFKNKKAELDQFPEWRETAPQPLE